MKTETEYFKHSGILPKSLCNKLPIIVAKSIKIQRRKQFIRVGQKSSFYGTHSLPLEKSYKKLCNL